MLGEIGVSVGEQVSGCKCCRCCPPNLAGVDGI